MYRWGVC